MLKNVARRLDEIRPMDIQERAEYKNELNISKKKVEIVLQVMKMCCEIHSKGKFLLIHTNHYSINFPSCDIFHILFIKIVKYFTFFL